MKNNKILIVDDDIDVINVLQAILENAGYQVIPALNKFEGLKKAYKEKPDLAILDVMMTTHYEGFEMAKELSENEEFAQMPVVMLTSIDILTTNNPSVQAMAREFRQDPRYKELQVILVKDVTTGASGIDYLAENGTSVWLKVDGFLRKPVDSKLILPEIEKQLVKNPQIVH
ncbi:MAG: response regulator [Bacteroidetes bacterium]|nr:response regulator [Bacteroidota bacterium]